MVQASMGRREAKGLGNDLDEDKDGALWQVCQEAKEEVVSNIKAKQYKEQAIAQDQHEGS